MNIIRSVGLGFVLAIPLAVFAADRAEAKCKTVKGHITSDLVATFSNGDACPSPLGLCTEGRYSGRLKGTFTFVADTLTPYAALDPAAPQDVAATTGTIELKTRFCDGKLALQDTSAFSLGADGLFGSVQTVDGVASEGGCRGASGRLRVFGVFEQGCVDCEYEGEICTVGDGHDDDED